MVKLDFLADSVNTGDQLILLNCLMAVTSEAKNEFSTFAVLRSTLMIGQLANLRTTNAGPHTVVPNYLLTKISKLFIIGVPMVANLIDTKVFKYFF